MSSFYLCSSAAFDMGLSKSAFKVYSFLALSANNITRDSYYSRFRIATLCKISESTVIRACRELCKKGLLEIRQRFSGKGRQTSNLYILLDNQQMSFSQPEAQKEDIPSEASIPVSNKKSSQNGPQAKSRLFSCPASAFQKNLTPNELKVYSYLSARAGKDHQCHPSYKEISADCKISVSTVYRAVKKLQEYDVIEVILQNRMETFGNNGRSVNLYLLKSTEKEADADSKLYAPIPQGDAEFSGSFVPESSIPEAKPTDQANTVRAGSTLCGILPPIFTPILTPSPTSPATPQRTKPRKNLKQRKKRLFSQVSKWYSLHNDAKSVILERLRQNKPP